MDKSGHPAGEQSIPVGVLCPPRLLVSKSDRRLSEVRRHPLFRRFRQDPPTATYSHQLGGDTQLTRPAHA